MTVNVNRVVLSGNLTRDPEMRYTQGGMAIMGIGVAVNDRRKNPQTGEWEDRPNFVDCVIFGKRAEAIEHYLHKGTSVVIDGKLRYESWEREGQKRSKLEVVVDEIQFSGKGRGQSEPEPQYEQPDAPGEPAQTSIYDDDIPF